MKPIILTTREVRGLLDKTITTIRRPIKPQPEFTQIHRWKGKCLYDGAECTWCWKDHVSPDCWNEEDWLNQFAPFQPSDVLYGKETWQKVFETECDKDANEVNIRALIKNFDDIPKTCMGLSTEWSCKAMKPRNKYYVYRASNIEYADLENSLYWRSPATMPREAARLFLMVDGVRAERVQEITPLGAWNEGYRIGRSFPWEEHIPDLQNMCRDVMFKGVWDERYAKRGFGWVANPWTWVYEIRTISADGARERSDT